MSDDYRWPPIAASEEGRTFNINSAESRMKNIVALGTAILLLSACAGAGYRPLVDTAGRDMNKYENDLRECQGYAEQVSGAGTGAAVGVAAGAIIGALFGGLAGGNRTQRNQTSALGAASGGLSGAASGEGSQRNVIRRCMGGRGYNVLQ